MTNTFIWCTIIIWNGDIMLNVNHNNVEAFFDYLDEATNIIFENQKKDYLNCFLKAIDYILKDDLSLNSLDDEIIKELDLIYQKIADITFNKEEIRKAVQLSLLKAFKYLNISFDMITPDTVGILYSYLVDLLFTNHENISVFDPNVGCGNLLFSLINNSKIEFNKIYGVDINYHFLDVSIHLANLLEYSVEFFNQNNLDKLLVPPVDLVISDLPTGNEENSSSEFNYKPYIMMDNFMKYGKEGAYYIYLIPNNFFTQPQNEMIKEIILSNTFIQAIIELPQSMFTDKKYQKSIIILQKKGKNIKVNKEILMLSFPNFNDKEKVTKAIDKINHWHKQNKLFGGLS